jgi:hypothetical protein
MEPHQLSRFLRSPSLHSLKYGAVFPESINQMRPRLKLCETPDHTDAIIEAMQEFLQHRVLNRGEDCIVEIDGDCKVVSKVPSLEFGLGFDQTPVQFFEHRLWNQRSSQPHNL